MVARSEIILSVRYKCVVVYKNKILSRTTTIKELNTTSSFTLTSNNIIKDVGYFMLLQIYLFKILLLKKKIKMLLLILG